VRHHVDPCERPPTTTTSASVDGIDIAAPEIIIDAVGQVE
jgi:hypothetical protein